LGASVEVPDVGGTAEPAAFPRDGPAVRHPDMPIRRRRPHGDPYSPEGATLPLWKAADPKDEVFLDYASDSREFPARPTLSAGVVAHNEEARLEAAVHSLLAQVLPEGSRWAEIWVVASGCTDGTVGVAESLAREDPRIRLLVEPDRGGKARALGEVLRRASGDALVLLNSDARAEPGSVGHLVRRAVGKSPPFAVMGRPVVSLESTGSWGDTMRWMWELHHQFHTELLAKANGGHLSDELLMVSLPQVPPIPPGIINDGAYFALWLAQNGGGQWYAPEARVTIQAPSTVRDHLRQRRRIHVGNRQLRTLFGMPPASVPWRLLTQPAQTVRLLQEMLTREGGVGHFARIAAAECFSYILAAWDRLPPRKDHVRWERIRTPTPQPMSSPHPVRGAEAIGDGLSGNDLEIRVGSLLRVAEKFGTGIPLPEFLALLPPDGPEDVNGLRRWLDNRPRLGRLQGGRVYSPTVLNDSAGDREERARDYRRYAEALWSGPLSFAKEILRCAGVTGSVAFGSPVPGDDIDLFAVPRTGALWWFLARTYLGLHLARHRDAQFRGPTVCLNYVVEDGEATAEFARCNGLLVAREVLTVQLLQGEDYYRGLVASAPWIRAEIPRLYETRSVRPGKIEAEPAPWMVRVLNPLVFPLLASYLQLAGLARNWRLRRLGLDDRRFRTLTRFRRLAFASQRFEELRWEYHRSPSGRGGALEEPGGIAARASP
jgi:Glycosyl transferase family 2